MKKLLLLFFILFINVVGFTEVVSLRDFSGSLQDAINRATVSGNSNGLVIIDKSINLDFDVEVYEQCTLEFISGNTITIPSGVILTINGSIIAGINQLFNCIGTGSVKGNPKIDHAYPEWFYKPDNGIDYSNAFKLSLGFHEKMKLTKGPKISAYQYIISNVEVQYAEIVGIDGADGKGGTSIYGAGDIFINVRQSIFRNLSISSAPTIEKETSLITAYEGSNDGNCIFENVEFRVATYHINGSGTNAKVNWIFQNCIFTNAEKISRVLNSFWAYSEINCYSKENRTSIYLVGGQSISLLNSVFELHDYVPIVIENPREINNILFEGLHFERNPDLPLIRFTNLTNESALRNITMINCYNHHVDGYPANDVSVDMNGPASSVINLTMIGCNDGKYSMTTSGGHNKSALVINSKSINLPNSKAILTSRVETPQAMLIKSRPEVGDGTVYDPNIAGLIIQNDGTSNDWYVLKALTGYGEVFSVTNDGEVHARNINFSNLPNSSLGLKSGDVWNDNGTLKIIP